MSEYTEKILFDSIEEATEEKIKRLGVWHPLHTNLIDDKIQVVFVRGEDDPVNSEEAIEMKNQMLRIEELSKKLHNNSITDNEVKELLKSKF